MKQNVDYTGWKSQHPGRDAASESSNAPLHISKAGFMTRDFRFRAVILGLLLFCWSLGLAFGDDKGTSSLRVIVFDSTKVAWITLTEKLEVVIAFKEPVDEVHSAMWTKARDIDAALKMIDLLQKSRIHALEISGKDALSLGGNQRCKVRCEILGFRFSSGNRD